MSLKPKIKRKKNTIIMAEKQIEEHDFHLIENDETQEAKEELSKESFNFLFDHTIAEETSKQEEGWENERGFFLKKFLKSKYKTEQRQEFQNKNKTSFSQHPEKTNFIMTIKPSENSLVTKKKSLGNYRKEQKNIICSSQFQKRQNITKVSLFPKKQHSSFQLSRKKTSYSNFQPTENSRVKSQTLNFINIGKERQKKIYSQILIKKNKKEIQDKVQKKALYSLSEKNTQMIKQKMSQTMKSENLKDLKIKKVEKQQERVRDKMKEFEKLKKIIHYERKKSLGFTLSPIKIVKL